MVRSNLCDIPSALGNSSWFVNMNTAPAIVLLSQNWPTFVTFSSYIDLIDKCRESYFQAQKSQKKVITLDIVEMILSKGGNFLKYDKRCKKWVSISTESARIKAAQALQYRQRRLGEKESDDLQSQASSTSTPTKQGLSTFGDSESLCSSVKDNVLLQKSMTWKTSLQKGVTVLGTVGSTSMEHEYSLETNLDAEVSLLFRDDFLSLENVVTSGFCILLLWKKNPN